MIPMGVAGAHLRFVGHQEISWSRNSPKAMGDHCARRIGFECLLCSAQLLLEVLDQCEIRFLSVGAFEAVTGAFQGK